MEDFNWKYDEKRRRHICEIGDVTLIVRVAKDFGYDWQVIVEKDDSIDVIHGSTHISINYACGKAEGAYMGLKATGKI